MIQSSATFLQSNDWKNQLASAIRDPLELIRLLELPEHLQSEFPGDFPLRVPLSYVKRMKKGDPNDPLFRQVFPLGDENIEVPGFSVDPVGDLAAQVLPGLLHKYQGRALLTITGACAIHCRYCFRRHFPYQDSNPLRQHWLQVMEYLNTNPGISEIILSGGDPLTLTDDKLADLLHELATLPHIHTLRIHSRLPVVLPDRITPAFTALLAALPVRVVMVIHANHANELNADVSNVLDKLHRANITLLNQSVLLRGVNDSITRLAALSRKLFQHHVLPYYLHQLDRVKGAAHFEVPVVDASRIMNGLKSALPGYLVPKLVMEKSGAASKIDLF